MPWHIVSGSSSCPASKPFAVVKNADGKVVGCHPTKAKAQAQLAALNINVKEGRMGADLPTEDLFRGLGLDAVGMQDQEGEPPILSVKVMRYGEWAEIDSRDEGHFMERFVSRSLDDSLAEETPKILFQHGLDPTMGRQVLAAPVTVRADAHEVVLEAPLGEGVPPLIAWGLRNRAYGASMQFSVTDQEVSRNPGRAEHNPQGLVERSVTKAKIREGGPVTWGAYPSATSSMRSLTDEFAPMDFDRWLEWMAREHPKDLAARIERVMPTRAPEPSEAKPASPPKFRTREEFIAWLTTS